jgi:hypothetical protein
MEDHHNLPGTSRPQRGDLVFWNGLDHVALGKRIKALESALGYFNSWLQHLKLLKQMRIHNSITLARIFAAAMGTSVLSMACFRVPPATTQVAPTTFTMKSDSVMDSTITLQFTPLALPPTSSGYSFRCSLDSMGAALLGQDSIMLTVMVAEKELLRRLETLAAGEHVSLQFAHYQDNAPSPRMPITGFVDANMRAWKVLKQE